MSEFFQVRKNTTLFPKGRNQIVMFLFLIWFLQWAYFLMCRLSLFPQTFQPILSEAHVGELGAQLTVTLPQDLCQPVKLRGDVLPGGSQQR